MTTQGFLKIIVEHESPPVRPAGMEWAAWLEGRDPEGDFPVGYGLTPHAAVDDLLERIGGGE